MSSTAHIASRTDIDRRSDGWLARILSTCADEPVRAVVTLLAFLVLAVLVLYPLLLLFYFSFKGEDGQLGLSQYQELFSDPGIASAATMSLWFMVEVTIGCLVVGVALAWLTMRTDMPGKLLIRGGAAIAFIIPSFINVIAWIFLLAPNSGYLNKLFIAWFGLETPPFNIFSFGGLVFIETAHLFPIVFFAVSAALGNVDASHEQAARILGAGRLRTTISITLPLVAPAIISSGVLCMLDALSSFGAPAVIGTMANFSVLPTKIYELLTFPPRLGVAAALAVPVAIFTLALLWLQQHLIRHNRFTTLTGKSAAPQLIELGPLRYLLSGFVLLVIFCVSLLPLFALVVLSLLKAFGSDIALENMSFSHYSAVFDSSFTVLASVQHSIFLALVAATLCIMIGVVLAWLVERSAFPGRGLAVSLVTVAFGIPSIILGIAILFAYIGWLYGTLSIILIAYTARHLPIAFVYVRSLVKQLSPELEEAGRVSGASWSRVLRDVTFPILRPGAFVAWLLIFSLCLREQPMSAILVQSDTAVMSTAVLQFIEDGSVEVAAAISVLIVAVSIGCLVLARMLAGMRSLQGDVH